MAKTGLLSCPLCLRADEADSMITVAIDKHALISDTKITLCTDCVTAILKAASDTAQSLQLTEQSENTVKTEGEPGNQPEPAPEKS